MAKKNKTNYPHAGVCGTLPKWFAFSLAGLIAFVVIVGMLSEVLK